MKQYFNTSQLQQDKKIYGTYKRKKLQTFYFAFESYKKMRRGLRKKDPVQVLVPEQTNQVKKMNVHQLNCKT